MITILKANVNELYNKVQGGEYLRIEQPKNRGTVWVTNDLKYIKWQNYGQSAVKNTLKDFTWLLEHIFEIQDLENINYRVVVCEWSD